MSVEFREEPCRNALNRVQNMPFKWSLNPYMGCAHRCTFCYVRGFERRADRPSGEAYGRSVRVKINVAQVLRRELARTSWTREVVAIGAATDPYQPAEGRYRLTRACLQALADARSPFSLITRGPMIVRDLDVLRRAATGADVDVTFSIPTLDPEIWRRTEPGTAPPRQRLRALRMLIRSEGRYRLTRACLQALADARSPFSLITRGPMIVRDLDVLRRAATGADVDVTFSIPTLDPEIWRRTEPGTAPPRQRLRALRMLI